MFTFVETYADIVYVAPGIYGTPWKPATVWVPFEVVVEFMLEN